MSEKLGEYQSDPGFPNENKIYLTENVTGDRFSLSYYDYEKDKIKLIYDDPKYDIGDSDSAPRLIVDPESKKLLKVLWGRVILPQFLGHSN